jgi:AraC-like DNA-binding protein
VVRSNVTLRLQVNWLLDWLVKNGLTHKELFSFTGLSQRSTVGSEVYLEFEDYLAVLNDAAEYMNEDFLGIRIASHIDVRNFGFVGELAHQCSTLRDSLQAAERYTAIVAPQMQGRYLEEGSTACFEYHVHVRSSEECRHDVELTLVDFVGFIRKYVGPEWFPDEVSFMHAKPGNSDIFHKFFGQYVRFDQPTNSMSFSANILDNRVSDTDPSLLKVLREHANSLLNEVDSTHNVVASVRLQIARSLGTDLCNARAIAASLFMSPRTLNRQLERGGTTFRSLKLSVIEELAKRALLDTHSRVTEIALNLGYSETASFDRVFKKITGLTPLEYRRQAGQ